MKMLKNDNKYFFLALLSCLVILQQSCNDVKSSKVEASIISKVFYSTGELKEKGGLIRDRKEGLWTFYDSDGFIRYEAIYEDGELNGQLISYFEDGDTLRIGYNVNGLEEGVWKQFQGGQILYSIGEYNEGKKVGEWKYYNESGNKIMRRILYENGKEIILEDHELSLPK